MEARIQQALAAFPPSQPASAIERMEHLAILKRWCYRGTRVGEIFFADAKGDLPIAAWSEALDESTKAKPPRFSPREDLFAAERPRAPRKPFVGFADAGRFARF